MITNDKIKENEYYIIFIITGGCGKNIQSTAVIRAIKKQYPDYKIVVIGSWDNVFHNNPNIYRFYNHSQINQGIYFNETYLNENTLIFQHDPYHSSNHILKKEHLTKTWTDLFNIKFDGDTPELYLNERELEIAKDKIKPNNRPIMLIQPNGGSNQQYSKKSWYRDMPVEITQKIINHFATKYRILHIKTPDQINYQNVEPLFIPHRELYAVFPLTEKRLFVDSFANHTSRALNLQCVTCWIGNSHKIFGYEENINIYPNAKIINNFNKYDFLLPDITGNINSFPYDTVNLFNIDEIIAAVESQK